MASKKSKDVEFEPLQASSESGRSQDTHTIDTFHHIVPDEHVIIKDLHQALEPYGVKAVFYQHQSLLTFGEHMDDALISAPKSEHTVLRSAFARLKSHLSFGKDHVFYVNDDGIPHSAANEDAKPGAFILTQIYGPNGRKGCFLLALKDETPVLENAEETQLYLYCQNAFRDLCAFIDDTYKTPRLSPRETEIVRLIAKGRSNPEIAEITKLSPHTVNGYLRGVYLKTQTTNRVALVLFALHKGLLL